MTIASRASGPGKPNALSTILSAGLLAGTLDILGAFAIYWPRGIKPFSILQSIATGVLGMKSYSGGVPTAALGLLLHFVIALGAAAVFFAVSTRLTFLRSRPVVWAVPYGIAVYFFMQLVVLPLSAFPHPITFPLDLLIPMLIVHVLCVALPITWITSRAWRR